MKSFLFLILAVTVFSAAPAMANEPAAGGAGSPVLVNEGGGSPGTPTTPSQPVPPPPVAKKEEEEVTMGPGFVKRVLAAAVGNKTLNATLTDKEARIAALEKENEELRARNGKLREQVEAQSIGLMEATEWIQGVASGTIDPVAKPAPNATAAAAAEAVKVNVSNVIRRTGVPVENLQPVERASRPAAVTNGTAGDDKEARLARLDAIWKAAGYDREAAATN